MNKRTLLSVLIAGACVAPFMAQAANLKETSSEPYTIKASDLAKKEKELNTFWKESLGIGRSPLKALKTNKEMVYLSEQLATMKRDIVIEESLEDMRLNINMKELKKQLKLYEMNSILAEVEKLNPEK